jgi:hypothetical protein
MHTVTLLARASSELQTEQASRYLKSTLEGLEVETQITGTTPRGWVQVSLSGRDENVALNYLTADIGLCPAEFGNVSKYETITGRLTDAEGKGDGVQVDIGIFSPKIVDAHIGLKCLQAQICDGNRIPLKKLNALFGLYKDLPLTVKILSIDNENGRIDAELAEKQRKQYEDWTESLLDRLLVMGASKKQIESAVESAGLGRYVTGIEPLGIFEYAVVCKIGTDAAGLIPRVGIRLGRATFSVFRPRTILRSFTQD